MTRSVFICKPLSRRFVCSTAIPRLEAPDFHVAIAVRNVDWGTRLLQFYQVNWSILLYSREISCRSFRHNRHLRPFTRFTQTPAAGSRARAAAHGGHTRASCSGKPHQSTDLATQVRTNATTTSWRVASIAPPKAIRRVRPNSASE
jgi:hypothetical protein